MAIVPGVKQRLTQHGKIRWRMLELHKQSPRSPLDKERLGREIESTDRAIDRLVYELYGLTEDEVRIVEGEK